MWARRGRVAAEALGLRRPLGVELAAIPRLLLALPLLLPLLVAARCGPGVSVYDFGAAGDGSTWDHAAIQQAINAAGEGGTVVFPEGTYTICSALRPLAGQVWIGSGTLKRCDSVRTTLAVKALARDTSITVEDASGYAVGLHVTPLVGPGMVDSEEFYVPYHRIVAIEGDVISFAVPLARSYPAGALVIAGDDIAAARGRDLSGLAILGLTFDGNRRGNPDLVAWTLGASLSLKGADLTILGNRFVDSWGNALSLTGTQGAVVHSNEFAGGASSAIHLSSADDTLIKLNSFSDTNRDAVLARHSEATITYSTKVGPVSVLGNRFCDVGQAAVGVMQFHANRDLTMAGNCVDGATAFFEARMSLDPLTGYEPPGGVRLEDNASRDVPLLQITTGAYTLRHIALSGNRFDGATLLLQGAFSGSAVAGNLLCGGSIDIPPELDAGGNLTHGKACNVPVDCGCGEPWGREPDS